MTSNDPYIPSIGDVLLLELDLVFGHEQGGERRVLVLSNSRYNNHMKLAVITPITTKIKGFSYEVKIPDGYKSHGAILSDQVRDISWTDRKFKYIETFDKSIVNEVVRKLNLLFRQ